MQKKPLLLLFTALGVIAFNYSAVLLFLNAFYLLYFLLLFVSAYFFYRMKFQKSYLLLLIGTLVVSSFFFSFFDEAVYESYLSFNLDRYYTYFGGEVATMLIFAHAVMLFFLAFKKIECYLGYNKAKIFRILRCI